MVELKPCPFCGGEAKIMDMGYPHWIYCLNCGAKVHGGVFGSVEASVEAWNKRVMDEQTIESIGKAYLAELFDKGII